MALFKVLNIRGVCVGHIHGNNEKEVMVEAKKLCMAPILEEVLSREERLQRHYEEEDRIWGEVNRHQRHASY